MKQLVLFFSNAALIALRSIFAQKMRAFLTLIGIIIGVSSVVIVGASISGFNEYILVTVSKILGVNHFMMNRFAHQGESSQEGIPDRRLRVARRELRQMQGRWSGG